jgi:hypothetical protein
MNKADNSAGRAASSAVHVWSFLFSSVPSQQAGSRRFSRNIKRAVVFQPDVALRRALSRAAQLKARCVQRHEMRRAACHVRSHAGITRPAFFPMYSAVLSAFVTLHAYYFAAFSHHCWSKKFVGLPRRVQGASRRRAHAVPLTQPSYLHSVERHLHYAMRALVCCRDRATRLIAHREFLPNNAIARSRVAYADTVAAIQRLQPRALSLQRDVGAMHLSSMRDRAIARKG